MNLNLEIIYLHLNLSHPQSLAPLASHHQWFQQSCPSSSQRQLKA